MLYKNQAAVTRQTSVAITSLIVLIHIRKIMWLDTVDWKLSSPHILKDTSSTSVRYYVGFSIHLVKLRLSLGNHIYSDTFSVKHLDEFIDGVKMSHHITKFLYRQQTGLAT